MDRAASPGNKTSLLTDLHRLRRHRYQPIVFADALQSLQENTFRSWLSGLIECALQYLMCDEYIATGCKAIYYVWSRNGCVRKEQRNSVKLSEHCAAT